MTITAQPTALSTGTWTIDPSHSEVSFTVRHLMVSKVRGTFSRFDGTITIDDEPDSSSVEATIDVASIDTRDAGRDGHLLSPDFFNAEHHPEMSFRSTAVRPVDDHWAVDGELTIRGTTRPVTLALELHGVATDPWGGTRAGFSASTAINRRDFGIDHVIPWDGGGVGGAVVGDKVSISLEIEAVLQVPASVEG